MGLSGIRPIGLLRLIGRDRAFGCSHKLFPEKVWAVRLSYPPPRQAGQGVAANPIEALPICGPTYLAAGPVTALSAACHLSLSRREQRNKMTSSNN